MQASTDEVIKGRNMIRYERCLRLDGRGGRPRCAKEQIEALLVGNDEPGLYRPSGTTQVLQELGVMVQRLQQKGANRRLVQLFRSEDLDNGLSAHAGNRQCMDVAFACLGEGLQAAARHDLQVRAESAAFLLVVHRRDRTLMNVDREGSVQQSSAQQAVRQETVVTSDICECTISRRKQACEVAESIAERRVESRAWLSAHGGAKLRGNSHAKDGLSKVA